MWALLAATPRHRHHLWAASMPGSRPLCTYASQELHASLLSPLHLCLAGVTPILSLSLSSSAVGPTGAGGSE